MSSLSDTSRKILTEGADMSGLQWYAREISLIIGNDLDAPQYPAAAKILKKAMNDLGKIK